MCCCVSWIKSNQTEQEQEVKCNSRFLGKNEKYNIC